MIGYRVEVTCPTDGHPLEHVTGGTTTRHETRAVARCTRCHARYVIAVHLTAVVEPHVDGHRPGTCPIEHGTERGYQQHRRTDGRHRRTHPNACDPCIDAHLEHNRPVKASTRRRRRAGTPLPLTTGGPA